MNFINAVRTWFLDCPFLKSGKALGVDFLADGTAYSLNVEPCDPIVKRYADGGTVRQFQFSFNAREKANVQTAENIENNDFLIALSDWIETQSIQGNLPDLGDILRPIDVTVISNGFATEQDDDTARYIIEFSLQYYQPWRYYYGQGN